MASLTVSLPILLLLLFSFYSGGILKLAHGQARTWCVAKPSSSVAELKANIQFACDAAGEQCTVMGEGGPCYYPGTDIHHASVAMNLYYQMMGRNTWNCDFRGSGLITLSDPSHGSCIYT